MATLATGALTLADWAKRLEPDGKVAKVAELLSQSNEILEDAVFQESNQATSHRSSIRTGLPAAYWRSINQGVPGSKSTTAQVDDSIGMLEAFSTVDKDLADLNGNTGAFRLSEDMAFLEAMNQAQAQAMLYGNPATDARQYLGLAPRYGAISGAGNAQNIIDAGGASTDNTSIWLIVWGENTIFNVFPKGTRAGLLHADLGVQTVYDSNNNPFQAYRTHYQWKNGLVVKDWRYAVRIANLKVGDLQGLSGTQATTAVATNLLHSLSRAMDRIPNFSMGRAAFYMNRTTYGTLRRLAMEKSVNALALQSGMNQFGTPQNWMSFEGVPLRRVDQILNTEARVV